jgi:transposase
MAPLCVSEQNIDASTGEVMMAQLFVAALGASNYTYAEATWTLGCPPRTD